VGEEAIAMPGPGEIVCAAQKSLISTGTETYCLRGIFDRGTNWEAWVQYPFRPGYSMSARVVAVGKGVAGWKEGDRVTAWVPHQGLFKIGPADIFPVPDQVSDEDATWMNLATTVQLGIRRGQHTMGEKVGVIGLGLLGQLAVQYLALTGARQIIVVDPVQQRLDMAKAHGATHTLALDVRDARGAVEELTGGTMLDVVYDITGNPVVLASCVSLLRRLGRVVLLGDTPNPTQQCLGPGVVSNAIAILGIHASMTPAQASVFNPWTRSEEVALFFDYLIQCRMKVSDLVTSRHSPVDAPEVYAALVEDRSSSMGIMFDWSSSQDASWSGVPERG